MKQYEVAIDETYNKIVIVEANDSQEAVDIVTEMYYNGELDNKEADNSGIDVYVLDSY